jgi:outer membrane protein TolC
VILARRVLAAEIRQLDAGLRTSTEVLDAQSRLASALSAEVLAVTNHQISQVDIAFASGLLLGAGNVYWEPVPPEKVRHYIP